MAEDKELTIASKNPAELLIAQAIDKGVTIETMEKLLSMRRELRAEYAKQKFDEAMAKFQAECPVIEKKKSVFEKNGTTVRYKYAPIDSIIEQVRKAISDNGLSYSFDEDKNETYTSIICTVTHIDGHSQKTTFKIPIGTEAFMSDVQKHGARMTFGKRYAFCNAFGIITGDEDNDAQNTGNNQQKPQGQKGNQGQKPTPGQNNQTVNTETQKREIMWLLEKLGYALNKKEEVVQKIKALTSLDLEQKNYTEIISRLKVLWKEKREAGNQEKQPEQKPIEPELQKAIDDIGLDDEKPAEIIKGEIEEKKEEKPAPRTLKATRSPLDPPRVPQAEV